MFLSNNFCYLELHRTGSTQISHLLKKYVPDGKQIGFHNRADKKTYNSKAEIKYQESIEYILMATPSAAGPFGS